MELYGTEEYAMLGFGYIDTICQQDKYTSLFWSLHVIWQYENDRISLSNRVLQRENQKIEEDWKR